jgi:hypothetical protein
MVRIFARWDVGLTPHTVNRVGDDQGDAVDIMNARGEAAGEAVPLC